MAAFYTPAPSCGNTEVEALKEQVAALQSQLDAERQQPDPLELAEEQYKLARKYLGGGTAADEEAGPTKQRRDSRLSVMQPVREGEVEASTLDPRADFAVERNLGFLTAAGGVAHADIPTVRACVAATQVIRAGSTVRLRLLEPVRIDGTVIPRNTPVYGTATISGMRLQLVVSSVEYGGQIFAVEASAYDLDGQPGLNVPNSRERTALKEALASVGQTAGTALDMWQKLAFTLVLVASFILLYQRRKFSAAVAGLRFYGRMSLTNYISQSVIGAFVYFPFGLYLAPRCGYTASLLVGILVFLLQVRFCKWWLGRYKQGPLEYIWHKWTWIGTDK